SRAAVNSRRRIFDPPGMLLGFYKTEDVATMVGTIRTGMAGWVFPDWRGGQFYPEGLKQKDELNWASRHVTAIEINSTFYQNQKPASFEAWAAQTPEEFVFTVKG